MEVLIQSIDNRTLELIREHQRNESFMTGLGNMIRSFVSTSIGFMDQYERDAKTQSTESKTIQEIRVLSKMLETQYGVVQRSIDTRMTEMNQGLVQEVKAQMSGLIQTIHGIVGSTMEKLDVGTISGQFEKTVIGLLDSKMQQSEQSIQQIMTKEIVGPYRESSQRLFDIVYKLPENMNQEYVKSLLNQFQALSERIRDNGINFERLTEQSIMRWQESKDLTISQKETVAEYMRSIPVLTKQVYDESLKDIDRKTETMRMLMEQMSKHQDDMRDRILTVDTLKSDLREEIRDVKHSVERVLEHSIRYNNNNKVRGTVAEDNFYKALESVLKPRDGYTISITSKTQHSSDMYIQHMHHPSVRVEVKSHGEISSSKVGKEDLKRFERDLIEKNEHGIMVSIYSGIVGKANIEIERLPTNKYALYISNNNYDIEFFVNMLHLIYKFHSYTSSNSDIQITPDTMCKIQSYINECRDNMESSKQLLKSALISLSKIDMSVVLTLLSMNRESREAVPKIRQRGTVVEESVKGVKCEYCDRGFAQPGRCYEKHVEGCKSKRK